jgi:hypothetical protein
LKRTRPNRPALAALVALALAGAVPGRAADPAPLPRPAPVDAAVAGAVDPAAEAALFAMPDIAEDRRLAFALAEAGELTEAAAVLDALAARHPGLGALAADRAALAMLAGDKGAARAALLAAADAGFPDLAALLADPLFAPLAGDPALAARAADPAPAPPEPVPAPVVNGRAPVSGANTGWNPVEERLEPRFAFPEAPAGPVLPRERPATATYDLLAEHARRGRAAGNHGDLYDNRDRGHSSLKREAFPQLAFVDYTAAARRADADYGLNDQLSFGRPTLGNSSTAVTAGALWRSLPRLAMTRGDGTGPLRLWQNASGNQLYVYPAHKDWDERDLFPANTPYILVSHGASGSDRPFLEAVAMIFAAFRPDTKERLARENLIVPTTQMVFRRSLQTVTSRDSYFSAAAHPAAFEGYQINLARMVSLANAIAPDAIPAEVRLAVLEEDLGVEGVDYFGAGLSEQLFDTPGAVARIWRSTAWRRSMLVSAEASRDPNGRPLAFEWRLLQGDPERVRIEPLDGGARARISLDWHEPFAISEDNPVVTSRVDIGVFASNGVHDSAPAILSWFFPPNETRRYAPGPDGTMRIAEVDYADPAKAATYADPMLIARADWRDVYGYAADGTPAGWTRHRPGRSEAFTAAGERVLVPAAAGRPAETLPVDYALERDAAGRLAVREVDADLY